MTVNFFNKKKYIKIGDIINVFIKRLYYIRGIIKG